MARSYASSDMMDSSARGGSRGIHRISWGAIFAGVTVIIVLHVLLGLLGVAVGLTTLDPGVSLEANPQASTVGVSAGAYWAIVAIVASFVGAWVAGRLAGIPDGTDGMLNGFVTWSVATILIIMALSSAVGGIVGGTFSTLGTAVQGIASGAQSAGSGAVSGGSALLRLLPGDLAAQAEQLFQRAQQQAPQVAGQAQQQAQQTQQQVQQATGTTSITDALQRVAAGVQEGASPQDRQAAITVISQQAGIPPQEAEQRLTQFQGSYQQAVGEARQTAQQAATAAAAAAWVSVVVLILGAVAAAFGGRLGGGSAERAAY